MKMTWLGLVLMLSAGWGLTQDEPSLAGVLAKYQTARGGADALAKVQSLRMEGIVEFNGFDHPFVMVQAGEGRYHWQAEGMTRYGTSFEAGKSMIVACDGDQAWVRFGTEDPPALVDLPAARTAYLKWEAEPFGAFAGPLRKGQTRTLAGRVDVDGRPAFHVRFEAAPDYVENWYLDTGTLLPFRMVVEMPTDRDYEVRRYWYFQDYRAVDGIQFPHYMEREDNQFVRVHHVASVQINPDVSNISFAKPATP